MKYKKFLLGCFFPAFAFADCYTFSDHQSWRSQCHNNYGTSYTLLIVGSSVGSDNESPVLLSKGTSCSSPSFSDGEYMLAVDNKYVNFRKFCNNYLEEHFTPVYREGSEFIQEQLIMNNFITIDGVNFSAKGATNYILSMRESL